LRPVSLLLSANNYETWNKHLALGGSGKDKQSIETQRNIRTLALGTWTHTNVFIRINARYHKSVHLVALNKYHAITKQTSPSTIN